MRSQFRSVQDAMALIDPQQATDDPISVLTAAGLLGQDALARARRLAVDSGETLTSTLTRLGLVSELDMAAAFAKALNLPQIDAASLPSSILPFEGLSPEFLRHSRVLPLVRQGDDGIGLAMADPSDDSAAEAVALFVGRAVHRFVALPTDIEAALERLMLQNA